MRVNFIDCTMAERKESGLLAREALPQAPRIEILGVRKGFPLLKFSDGQAHPMTLWERIQYQFGWTDTWKLQRKWRPRLTDEIDGMLAAAQSGTKIAA